jgi:hypothetical protein
MKLSVREGRREVQRINMTLDEFNNNVDPKRTIVIE